MSPEEYTERLQTLYGLQNDLAEYTILPAAAELLIAIKQRIVNDGKNTADGNIGDYSTKPMYVEKEQFAKPGAFNPQGKNNVMGLTMGDRLVPSVRLKQTGIRRNPVKYKRYTITKPNLQQRISMYLPEGYKQLRDIQALRTDIMNFKYRGDLINSYKLQKVSQSVLLGLTDPLSAKKREKLEARFGPVFYATGNEIANYTERVSFLMQRLTRGVLQGEGVEVVPTVEYI